MPHFSGLGQPLGRFGEVLIDADATDIGEAKIELAVGIALLRSLLEASDSHLEILLNSPPLLIEDTQVNQGGGVSLIGGLGVPMNRQGKVLGDLREKLREGVQKDPGMDSGSGPGIRRRHRPISAGS